MVVGNASAQRSQAIQHGLVGRIDAQLGATRIALAMTGTAPEEYDSV